MKLLLYCTKSKPYLIGRKTDSYYLDKGGKDSVMDGRDFIHNGKIVAECDYEVEKIKNKITQNNTHLTLYTNTLSENELFNKSCLTRYEMFNYLSNNFTQKCELNGYAIHIKNLHIFDEPMELSDYITKQCQFDKCSTCEYGKKEVHCGTIDIPITKAPQNMMYCYDEKEKKVLISIRPEWLCKILNGEKTIEIRKKVLKGMKKDEKQRIDTKNKRF